MLVVSIFFDGSLFASSCVEEVKLQEVNAPTSKEKKNIFFIFLLISTKIDEFYKMETYRTSVSPKPLVHKIDYTSSILFLGSCFSQNIGEIFLENKFNIDINPFGITYNPLSISNSLLRIIEGKLYQKEDLFFHQEQWHSLDHHGSFSDIDYNNCLTKINQRLLQTHNELGKLTHLVITLGTNYYYYNILNKRSVNNCHKLAGNEFERREMSKEEIQKVLLGCIEKIKQINSNIQVVFSVSPVRYLQDGLQENSFSKAKLLCAIDDLIKHDNNICYFPAYEIMIDDLRDYRFYKEDMIHPSTLAINHIWQSVKKSMISNSCGNIMSELESIRKDLLHRPRQPKSHTFQDFLLKIESRILNIQQNNPHLNFVEELRQIEEGLLSM